MEHISNMFSRSQDNKNPRKGDTRTDIKRFQKKMLMEMIETPDIIKIHMNPNSSVLVKLSDVKPYSKLFGA